MIMYVKNLQGGNLLTGYVRRIPETSTKKRGPGIKVAIPDRAGDGVIESFVKYVCGSPREKHSKQPRSLALSLLPPSSTLMGAKERQPGIEVSKRQQLCQL